MKTFFAFLDRYVLAISLSMPILYVIFLSFEHYQRNIPIPIYYTIHPKLQTALFLGLFIYFPLLIISNLRTQYKLLPLLLLVPFICMTSYVVFDNDQQIIASRKQGADNFYLLEEGSHFEVWQGATLIRCDNFDCEYLYSPLPWAGRYDLFANELLKEVYLFRAGDMFYIYGPQEEYDAIETYRTSDSERYGDSHHHANVLEGSDSFRIVVFICYLSGSRNCDIAPVKIFIGPKSDFWKPVFDGREWRSSISNGDIEIDLVIDEAGEASVYVEDILVYSYGSQAQCHVEDCEIVGPE